MSRTWSAILVVLAISGAPAAVACSCVEDDSPVRKQVEKALHGADFVAEVEVVSTAEITESKEVSGKRWSWAERQYLDFTEIQPETRLQAEINVLRLWKGQRTTASVSTAMGMPACGLPFRPGQRLLLYANVDKDAGRLVSSSCSRTNLADDAGEDIKLLNELTSKIPPDKTLGRAREE